MRIVHCPMAGGEAVSVSIKCDRGNVALTLYYTHIYYYIRMIMTKFLSKSFRNDVAEMMSIR